VFLRSFFSAPTPGIFEIADDGSPRITADATRQMEAEWLALLRGVSGAAKVDARLSLAPSVYQLPGYRPESQVADGTLAPLMEVLNHASFMFDPVTNTLPDDEATRLDALAPLMTACGPGLRLILTASGGTAHNSPAGHKASCEIAKARLVAFGMAAEQIEIADLGPLRPPRALAADAETVLGVRLEMLVK